MDVWFLIYLRIRILPALFVSLSFNAKPPYHEKGLPFRARPGPFGRAVGHADHIRPPLDVDGATTCLFVAGGRHGQELAGRLCAVLATGRPMPVISQGHNEEELEKRLGAALLAGDTAISLDNCDHEVGGAFLCQVLTQRHLNIRILGLSKHAEMLINATIFATGNNLLESRGFCSCGQAEYRHRMSVLPVCDEFCESADFGGNQEKIGQRQAR